MAFPTQFFSLYSAIILACGSSLSLAAVPTTAPVSAIADHLRYIGPSIREAGYTVWGASPVVDDAGKVHLFADRWPEENVDPGWKRSSEIAHYVADRPEGPFRFVSVVLKSSGIEGRWDRYAPHNAEIKRFGNIYALLFIANSDYQKPAHPLNQKIGMMTAKSPDGPWTPVGTDGLLLNNQAGHFTEGRQVVNPTLLQFGGKFYLYYKTTAVVDKKVRTRFGVAIADKLEGPYVHQPKPVTAGGLWVEDGSAFEWNGKVCLLATDNEGLVTGIKGGLSLWVSDDGIQFNPTWTQLGMRLFPAYLTAYDETKVKKVYGKSPKPERPKVLMIAGEPAYLYTASGLVYDGSGRCENHVFRIELPPDAGPLPDALTSTKR